MIKFFRKIRQKLLDEGKLSKYLIYAVGEILLVMIGILLALYVSNSNDQRKEIAKSIEVMNEIKQNLESNTKQFYDEMALEKKVVSSIDIVMNNINETQVYHDSLDKHFHLCMFWTPTTWQASGYEALKSHGVELISSDILRTEIVELYENIYPEISEIIRTSEGYSFSTTMPISTELFLFNDTQIGQSYDEYKASPFDYNQVLSSNKLRGVLSFWRISRVMGVQVRENAINGNEKLIQLIESELSKEQ